MSSTWACHVCTLENPARHKRCNACKARRAVDESSQSQSHSSSVRSWLSRRRKRKRPQQPTVRVKIRLDGNEVWGELLEARLPPPAADSIPEDGETVSETRDRHDTTQSTMADSFPDACAGRHLTATTACGKRSVEIPKADPNISPTLVANYTIAMETTHCHEEPRNSNDGMNHCAPTSPGFEHESVSQNHARAYNAQISNKPPFSPPHDSRDSSVVVLDPRHKDISSFPACHDENIVDISSSQEDCCVEIGFSQLMSQQQSGFLYTQMTQSEPEFKSFPDPAIGKGNCSPKRTVANVTTHGYNTREHEESCCNPEPATEKALSNDEPDYLTNKANAPLDAKQSHTMPSRPMFERVGTGSRIQVSKERLQMTDELLRKETTPTYFAQCTFQTAGKGAVISVTEEHLSRATALLQDASAEKDPFAPLRDFSSTSTSCRQPEALFHTAGKKNVISVSEDSMARATTLLQDASVPAVDVDRKESSPQATSSVSASAPQFAATFHTAGKKAIVSVTDDSMTWANTLLHDATATDAPKIYSIPVVANGPQSAAMFQTAGTGSLITVKDESMARATALLKDTVSVSTSRNLSSAPSRSSQIGSMFQTAGKGSVISVSDDSMARATAPLQKASATDGKDSKQAISSLTTRAPPYAAAFHTAGKKNVITVTEGSMVRASTLLQDATTTDVELSPQPRLLPVANSPQLVAMFQTAGKGSVISVQEESIARATALLQDKSVATSEAETYSLSRDLSSAPTSLPQPGYMFQTAGKGRVISVSDGSMALATAILQDSSVTVDKVRKNELSQAVSSISTSVPQVATLFHTAGKKNVLSVTEDGIMRAKTLLQDERATEVKPVSKMRLSPVATGPVAMFETAGKGSVISVQEESIVRATALLRDKSVATSEVDTYPLSRDLSSAPTILPQPRSMFQTAGKGSVISVSDDSIARAAALLQDSSVSIAEAGTKESSQAASSVSASTSDPQCTATFLTAGKKAVVSVTEDGLVHTNALLQKKTATFVEQASQICLSSAANGSQSAIKFASMKESMAWATTLLKDTPASNFEVDLKKPPRELTSAETIYPGSAAIFQTAGQGSVVSVSEESLARAVEVVHDSWVANEDETTTRAFQRGDMMSSPVKKCARVDVSDECRVKAAEGATKECNTGFANSSCDYTQDTDEGLITQPVPPETPLLPYRRDQLESLQHEETYVAIRSVAFGLTPQSQHTRGHLIQRRQEAFDSSPETNFESPDDVHPEPYTNLANQATPSSRLLVSETRKRRAYLSQSILAQPAFTPKQTPAANASAAVTMSVDPKNPYLRNRHNNPNSSPNLKDAYSPVPIDFRHTDGSFRGKVISPSSISYAESVLSRRPGESGNELKKLPVSAHSGESTLLVSRTKKKVVTWSEDTVKSDQVPTRTTLSNFAAEYGMMNDYVSVGLDAGIHAVTLAIDSNNAPRIRFDAESELPCSLFGQPCPPKCKIVGSVKDLRASLLSRGCEEKKLVDKWISNHYRWIVWKLASMERRFASSLAHSYLTYDHVITQLKKRYDRELQGGERSALRKVLNRDVAANCMMILCVCQTLRPIKDEGTDNKDSKHDECALEMTDGWYSIRGVLDASLSAHVRNGKIKGGTKLLICNGRMEGSEDGVDPLDPSYSCSGQNCSVALFLSANGTRLANWDAKMGFVKPSQYIRSTRGSLLVRSISHIIPGGGNVPLIDVIICRRYPRMFLERKGTNNPSEELERPGGKSPVISEAQEYKNRMDFEKKRQQAIERMSETVQNDCAKEVDEMAPGLWRSIMKSVSPCDFYEQLSRCDQVVVDKWKEKRDTLLRDMAQKEIEARLDGDTAMFRESTPFIRFFVKSYNSFNKKKGTDETVCEGALLTIWNPSEQQRSLLREGHVVRIRNLSVRATKHEGLMQLTAGAKTQMESILSSPLLPSKLASLGYSNRVFAKLFRVHAIAKKLSGNLLPSSPAPEVDTAAILLRVSQEGSTEERELIYMTDETGLVLRVERDRTSDHDDIFISRSQSARQNTENPTSVAFRDLRITHFDSAENCAVAVYTQTSSVASKTPRFSELLKWAESPSGRRLLRRLAACMDSGIPLNQPASNQTAIATGYIAGFNIPERSNDSHLEIMVDCGMAELQVWELPFFLLDDALSLCNVAREPVSLEREVDEKYAKLKVLGKIFGARGLLLLFSLRRKSNMACEDGKYEVRKVNVADSNALAHVYVSTVKDAGQERKRRLEKQIK